jgi:uncharacterized protein YqeY
MSIKEQIMNDMKHYMKEKNEIALNAIRLLRADIKNAEIDKQKELTDEEVMQIVSSSIKKRKESIEMYKKGARQDLVDKEMAEIKVIEKYLPEQLNDDDIRQIILETINEEEEKNKRNFGIIMKKVIGKIKNRAEGSKINKLVKEIIDGIK